MYLLLKVILVTQTVVVWKKKQGKIGVLSL